MKKTIATATAVITGILLMTACTGEDMQKTDPPAKVADQAKSKTDAKPAKSEAETFKDCVAKNGTPQEKAAVQHVTKVTGTDKRNDILDSADVYTDYSGGLLGEDATKGKLVAAAFVSCYESDNGLVTVYDKDAGILANANF